LRTQGFRGDVAVLAGLLPLRSDVDSSSAVASRTPTVLFVGRHVKHKGVRLLPAIFAAARESLPDLTMTVVGEGPERGSVEADVALLALTDAVTFAGHVSDEELTLLFMRASCTVVPSMREGYGMVVAESASAGTPVVVANNAENLATSLIEPGVNGYVVDPSVLGMADGIVAVVTAGLPLRQSTAAWSREHASTKSMNQSACEMVDRLSAHF
jgi:glycosyltransferase involved in cell wall biosynthesis